MPFIPVKIFLPPIFPYTIGGRTMVKVSTTHSYRYRTEKTKLYFVIIYYAGLSLCEGWVIQAPNFRGR